MKGMVLKGLRRNYYLKIKDTWLDKAINKSAKKLKITRARFLLGTIATVLTNPSIPPVCDTT